MKETEPERKSEANSDLLRLRSFLGEQIFLSMFNVDSVVLKVPLLLSLYVGKDDEEPLYFRWVTATSAGRTRSGRLGARHHSDSVSTLSSATEQEDSPSEQQQRPREQYGRRSSFQQQQTGRSAV